MPEALNYRVGPHPGAPLSALCTYLQSRTPVGGGGGGPCMCLRCQTTEGSQGREHSRCTRVQLQRKTSRRVLLIASYKRLEKTLLGPNSCRGGSLCPCTLGATRGLKPSSCVTFTLTFHWGRAATARKVLCLCMQGRFGHVRLFATL